jgi:Kef-type K+ transport system membrane component KefB
VVVEIGLGIVAGPQVLALAESGPIVGVLANLGLCFLLFLAGYEIDVQRIRGRPLKLAGIGWLISLALGLGVGATLHATGATLSTLLIGLALTTTALGALLPILKDHGLLETRFGTFVMGAGTVGEFGPIVAIALLFGGHNPLESGILLAAFVIVAVLATVLSMRIRTPRLLRLLRETMHSSGQLAVRVSVLLLVALLLIASKMSLDVLLGAFAAGLIVRLVSAGDDAKPVTAKLEAIGFGFLIPVFFVSTGLTFDLDALLESPATLLKLPVILGLFLLVRGVPALLYRRDLGRRELATLALFSATALPLVVVITHIGLSTGHMRSDNAAALVGAGMLSVFLFPLIGLSLRGGERAAATPDTPGEDVQS